MASSQQQQQQQRLQHKKQPRATATQPRVAHTLDARRQLSIPLEFNAGMTEQQKQELAVLMDKFKWPPGHCATASEFGSHAGTSCGLRLLCYLRHQDREQQ